jgi:hypothetical protein
MSWARFYPLLSDSNLANEGETRPLRQPRGWSSLATPTFLPSAGGGHAFTPFIEIYVVEELFSNALYTAIALGSHVVCWNGARD